MHSMREKTQDERDLLERARSLVPALKARTAQADKDLKVPVESVVELLYVNCFYKHLICYCWMSQQTTWTPNLFCGSNNTSTSIQAPL